MNLSTYIKRQKNSIMQIAIIKEIPLKMAIKWILINNTKIK